MAWSDLISHSSPGALRADVSVHGFDDMNYFRYFHESLGDLSGKTITAYIYLESGPFMIATIYALDADWYWANGDWVTLSVGEWVCAALELDAPLNTTGSFSPTTILDVGVGFQGDGDAILVLDDVGY